MSVSNNKTKISLRSITIFKKEVYILNTQYLSEQMNRTIWLDYIKRFRVGTTIASYQSDLEEFCSFIKKDFLLMDSEDVKNFYEYLDQKVSEGTLKSSTMAKKFHELHSIADYIVENQENYEIPDTFSDFFYPYLLQVAEVAKVAKTIPPEHVDLLFKAAEEDHMAYTIMALMFKAGIKSSEVIALKVRNLAEYDNGIFAYISARKESCFIPDDAAVILQKYLNARKEPVSLNHDFLFFNTKGNPLNLMYISRIMKKYCTLAGIPQYSANTLRAACAANMFLYEIPMKNVATQMGVTCKHIARYNGRVYKDQMMSAVNRMVKVHVDLPE